MTVRDTDATDISCCGIQLPDRAYLHSVKTKGFLAPGEELYLLDTDKSGILSILSRDAFAREELDFPSRL